MSSINRFGNHSGHADFMGLRLGKQVQPIHRKNVPHQEEDQLTQMRSLKDKSDKFVYEALFTYEIQRPIGVNTFRTEEGSSFTCFKHDKVLSDPEIRDIAIERIKDNRFKGCRLIDLKFLGLKRRI